MDKPKGRRDKALLSVKFGAMRGPDGSWVGYDARPASIKNFLAYSLNRLGVDHIDIYRPARLDPIVPIEETAGALNTIAAEKGATATQLAIAWVLAKGENIVPLVGARKRSQLRESLDAMAIQLTANDLAKIEESIPRDAVAGTRYGQD